MENHNKLVQLRHIIQERLSLKEVKTLCFDLEYTDFEDLAGSAKGEKIISLLQHLEHRRRLDEVVRWLALNRPDIDVEQAVAGGTPHEPKDDGQGGAVAVEVEDSTFLQSKVKARGGGIGLRNLFSWGSEIDISTTGKADPDEG